MLTGTSSPIHSNPTVKRASTADAVSVMCLSLMSSPETSLLDLVCCSATQFSEWTDGFNMLFDRNIANKDTAEFIQSLTDIQLRLQLLDVVSEKLDLGGTAIQAPPLPLSASFWYDDVGGMGAAV